MKIIDISKCPDEVISYINELIDKYAELEKLNKELDKSNITIFEENDYLIKENRRLNSIINKLEEELRSDYTVWMCGARQNGKSVKFGIDVCKTHFYNRLQELKGGNSNE